MAKTNKKLGRRLILDELFDFTLYKRLLEIEKGELAKLLEELVPTEEKHYHFWRKFFDLKIEKLNWSRKLKLELIVLCRRIFGEKFIHLVLESIEIYGVRKYLLVWGDYKDAPLGAAIKEVLEDELRHEDALVSRFIEKKIDAEKIRDIFLGLNDGLVEILGAVSGFFAIFSNPVSVLIAGLTVAVAGSFSMAAGVYVGAGSRNEVENIEEKKREFFDNKKEGEIRKEKVLSSAILVGIFYLVGALVPIAPILLGAKSVFISVVAGALMIVAISFVVAFISGMNVKKRVLINLIIVATAVVITYLLGTIVKNL